MRPIIYVEIFVSSFNTPFFQSVSIVNHLITLCNQWYLYLVFRRIFLRPIIYVEIFVSSFNTPFFSININSESFNHSMQSMVFVLSFRARVFYVQSFTSGSEKFCMHISVQYLSMIIEEENTNIFRRTFISVHLQPKRAEARM